MRYFIRFAALSCALVGTAAMAQVVQLVDAGTSASINAGTWSTTDLPGLTKWTVGGPTNHVGIQVYAIKIGDEAVMAVNDISAPVVTQPTPYLANIGYTQANMGFSLDFRYLLTGGVPNSADLAEVATFTNRSGKNLKIKLFEFDYFTLGGAPGGVATLLNTSTIQQTNNGVSVTVGATPIPSSWMIDTSNNVVAALSAGALANATSPFANPDIAFAYQWDAEVAAGSSWQMSKNKLLVVPEPASMLALGAGLAVLLRRRRK